jgi:hypothetical protein
VLPASFVPRTGIEDLKPCSFQLVFIISKNLQSGAPLGSKVEDSGQLPLDLLALRRHGLVSVIVIKYSSQRERQLVVFLVA